MNFNQNEELEDLKAENERLSNIEFIHRGCEGLRHGDNAYLLNRAETAERRNRQLEHERKLLAIAIVQIAETLGEPANPERWKIDALTGPELLVLAEDIKAEIKDRELNWPKIRVKPTPKVSRSGW